MRVHCLSTGAVRAKAGERGVRRYLADDWAGEALPVNVFAIEHSAGICLFDTGQTAEATRPGYFPRWYPFFRLSRFELEPEDEAAPQLTRHGLDASRLRWVVLSHLHTDHVGGLSAFRGAEVLVSRTEWRRATGLRGRLRGYLPQYWPPWLVPTLVDFEDPGVGPFRAAHDLARDGRLVLVPTPGHTSGHMSLLVRGDGERYLCGGDAARGLDDLDRRVPELAAFCRSEGVVFLASHDSRARGLASPKVRRQEAEELRAHPA
jgi:glyoxylase-like metal-dependent hydrolase (beta-lactamase superfamily II)